MTIRPLLWTAALAVCFPAIAGAHDGTHPIPPDAAPRIEVALLLDTSGSMSGLIHQAQSQLWRIVNEFGGARKDGKQPVVYVALYEYGKSSLPGSEGFTRLILPLTDDLDRVSEELFKLRTNGGQEYCGYVIDQSVEELSWSDRPGDMRCIFIAGNEPFTQGEVDFREACRKAIEKNINVNTIFCGPHIKGIRTMWSEGARLGEGSYLNIDHNREIPSVSAPQDEQLSSLSIQLNKTYIAYGAKPVRDESLARQSAQDSNAAGVGQSSVASRASTKASSLYRNSSWDIIDACRERKLNLADIPKEHLPEELREMTLEQLQKHVDSMRIERERIQLEIKRLSEARTAFVSKKRAELAAAGEDTLDAALIKAVRQQAARAGFEF